MPNQSGIAISNSTANQIGLNDVQSRNIISGNGTYGIVFSYSSSNVVEGNYIGTNLDGSSPVPNILDGIFFEIYADFNTIGGSAPGTGNLISGNRGNGVRSFLSFSNVIEGNRIGTDSSGLAVVANGLCGINGGNDYTIGGTNSNARNVISGNGVHGIEIRSHISDIVVQGNFIGTDVTGATALGNGVAGISVVVGSPLIGGVEPGARNIISGNGAFGILIEAQDSRGSVIQGNWIGLNARGDGALSNHTGGIRLFATSNNLIGGNEPAGNVISGNAFVGILVDGGGSNNVMQGNLVGTDPQGRFAIPNLGAGILIGGSSRNIVGGLEPTTRNLVSGNLEEGIRIGASSATNNTVVGNYVGTDASGARRIPNFIGVLLERCSGTAVENNLISGNLRAGLAITGPNTVVGGNLIGTDVTGRTALSNHTGIRIRSAANTIGGTEPGSRNIISGNRAGINVGAGSISNVIQGNYIGVNRDGTAALANSAYGIALSGGASATTIGGIEAGAGNVISGNGGEEPELSAGIVMYDSATTNNVVHGNRIGTDAAGRVGVPNQLAGVRIGGANRNHIGGATPGEGNVIAYNNGYGVLVESDAMRTLILGNAIHSNAGLGIDLGSDGVTPNDIGDGDIGPNNLQNFPVITNVVYLANNTIVQGYLRSSIDRSFSIDVYANVATEQSGYGEGQFYIGNVDVDTDESGFTEFAFSAGNAFSNQFFTATALSYDTGDTSEFSAAMGGIRITSIERISNQYRVSFSTIANRSYAVQRTGNLNSSAVWSTLGVPAPILGTGGIMMITDPIPATDLMRVYRVREEP